MVQMILYREKNSETAEEEFLDFLQDVRLSHLASDMFVYGFNDSEELAAAVERAINVCRTLQISVRQNFKPVYIYRDSGIIKDWRLSDLGRKLVILNGDCKNPYVAQLQIQLLSNFKI
jgi:hypothetical protein